MADETKVVTLTIAEIQAMIAEGVKNGIAAAQPEGYAQGNARILRRNTDRKVEVRFIDKKAVLGYFNRGTDNRPQYIYTKPDPRDPRKEIEMVDLVLEDSKEALSVEWSQFRKESARSMCKVVKTESKEWLLNQGTVKKREVEEYSSVELDFDVPLDVVGQARFFTVEVPADFGTPRQVTLHENFVNIA